MKYEEINDKYVKLVYDSIKNVPSSFFEIETANGVSPIRRERVFCYELYHQMRCIQTIKRLNLNDFSINAEIDKSGHAIIKQKFNPDFIIHEQRNMTNHIVIEVKTNANRAGILKDFETIKCMINCYNYIYGIFIMTSKDLNWFKNNILNELKDRFLIKNPNRVYLFLKEKKRQSY